MPTSSPKPAPTITKLLYNKKEAAYALGISVRSIESLLASKQLSTRKYGNKVLIPAADIRRLARLEQLRD